MVLSPFLTTSLLVYSSGDMVSGVAYHAVGLGLNPVRPKGFFFKKNMPFFRSGCDLEAFCAEKFTWVKEPYISNLNDYL